MDDESEQTGCRRIRPRLIVDEVVRAVAAACARSDAAALASLLARHVVAVVDRGSREGAGARGRDDVARLLLDLCEGAAVECAPVNGQPGIALRRGGRVAGVVSFSCGRHRVRAVFVTLNPDKLGQFN